MASDLQLLRNRLQPPLEDEKKVQHPGSSISETFPFNCSSHKAYASYGMLKAFGESCKNLP